MVTWWLPVDLLNTLANIDYLEMWLASIERSFRGLSVAFKTVRIVEELMEIWLNEVCDKNESNFSKMVSVMNIEWNYNYYQPWSDNEWIVNEILALLDEDITMQ